MGKYLRTIFWIGLVSLVGACGGGGGGGGGVGDDKIIFTTVSQFDGNLRGVSGADDSCMSDENYPGTGTYKALIVDSTNRVASVTANTGDGQVDWILQPNTDYVQSDGTTAIMTTDANGLFVFGELTNSITAGGSDYWTGLDANWQPGGDTTLCANWTSNSVTEDANYGEGSFVNGRAIASDNSFCDESLWLACVEQ